MVDQNAESTDANFRFDGFVSGEMRAESSPRLLHPMKEHFGLAIDKSRFQEESGFEPTRRVSTFLT
jgi:hypothetical protein